MNHIDVEELTHVSNRLRRDIQEECGLPESLLLDLAKYMIAVDGLVGEYERAHRDPDSSDYNECDKISCRWCDIARSILPNDKDQ